MDTGERSYGKCRIKGVKVGSTTVDERSTGIMKQLRYIHICISTLLLVGCKSNFPPKPEISPGPTKYIISQDDIHNILKSACLKSKVQSFHRIFAATERVDKKWLCLTTCYIKLDQSSLMFQSKIRETLNLLDEIRKGIFSVLDSKSVYEKQSKLNEFSYKDEKWG
jgi:hypothetical protein